MKRSIGVTLACGLILTVGLIAWAQGTWTTTKVTGGGWFISEDDTTLENHCSFGFQAQLKKDRWSGRGSFTDRNYPLKAILTITDAIVPTSTGDGHVLFSGTATVYVNDALSGTDVQFSFGVVDSAVDTDLAADAAGFGIPSLSYHSNGSLSGGQIKMH